MSKIRLWKLGSLEHKVYPTEKAVENLTAILEEANKSEEDIYDIIWGPDIDCKVIDLDKDAIDIIEIEDVKSFNVNMEAFELLGRLLALWNLSHEKYHYENVAKNTGLYHHRAMLKLLEDVNTFLNTTRRFN